MGSYLPEDLTGELSQDDLRLFQNVANEQHVDLTKVRDIEQQLDAVEAMASSPSVHGYGGLYTEADDGGLFPVDEVEPQLRPATPAVSVHQEQEIVEDDEQPMFLPPPKVSSRSPMQARYLGSSPRHPMYSESPLPEDSAADRREKQALLHELKRLERRGMALTRTFTMQDPISEMKFEIESILLDEDSQNMVSQIRGYVGIGAFAIEQVNNAVGPILKLDGWAESFYNSSAEKLDRPIEIIYRRYCRRRQSNPFMEILMIVVTSMIMHHLSQKFADGTGMDFLLKVANKQGWLNKLFAPKAGAATTVPEQRAGAAAGEPPINPGRRRVLVDPDTLA